MADTRTAETAETEDAAEAAVTVLERMLAARISEDRAHEYLRTQWIRYGDEIITDPDAVVPTYTIKPPPSTENT